MQERPLCQFTQSILEQLREYFIEHRPKEYLFEGQYGGQYSIRSAQEVFKNALRNSKINKPLGIHSLRHSFATHLLEHGIKYNCNQINMFYKRIYKSNRIF